MNTTENSRGLKTDHLIAILALQATQPEARHIGFRPILVSALLIAPLLSLVLVLVVAGPRTDLSTAWLGWAFQFKFIGMALMAGGSAVCVRRISAAGQPVQAPWMLLPAVLFLAAGAAFDHSGFPVSGQRVFSVPVCVGTIVLAALPALAVLLAALRRGTPTSLRKAGAMAGVLAGSLAGMAYAIACMNDGAGFVALWYLLAIGVTGTIGAVLGQRALAW